MLSVQNNILAMNADRQLKANTKKNARTTERLSSGYKINRSADDAAGLSMSEKMRRQIRGLHQSADNISEGIGYVQTAEGALNEVQDMLHRINELAVKAANGTNTEEDRQYIDSEVQQLKEEMDRIFSTTTFNERKIWEAKDRVQIGTTQRNAVTMHATLRLPSPSSVTNANYEVFPGGNLYSSSANSYRGYFDLKGDDKGVHVEWTGYNGTKYVTKAIEWETLEANDYKFEMSDLFDKNAAPELYEKDGITPVFNYLVSFNVAETADKDEVRKSIGSSRISATVSTSMRGSWENTKGNNANMTIGDVYLNYPAAYASLKGSGTAADGHNFDTADDSFLEPVVTNETNLTKFPKAATVEEAKNGGGWEFTFFMKGIGNVTASSKSITYYSNDYDEEDKGFWWNYHYYYDGHGNVIDKRKESIGKPAEGTLAGAMSALTGDENDGTPGLLNRKLNGCNDGTSGTIQINFNLTAANNFQYADANGSVVSSSDVGSFTLSLSFSSSETEDDVLRKINNALNENSILDFNTSGYYADSISTNTHISSFTVDEPVWGGICDFYVQGGTESGEHITIKYDALSVIGLGLQDTNVLTIIDAGKAITEVKEGLRIVSEQRAAFGAYQNRLEHAENINRNGEENTQAAESVLRDADIADEMMEYSVDNILMQAGTSMLTQANQSKQLVLQLLE